MNLANRIALSDLLEPNPEDDYSMKKELLPAPPDEINIDLEMFAATDLELMQEDADRELVEAMQSRKRDRLGRSINLGEW